MNEILFLDCTSNLLTVNKTNSNLPTPLPPPLLMLQNCVVYVNANMYSSNEENVLQIQKQWLCFNTLNTPECKCEIAIRNLNTVYIFTKHPH